MEAIDFSTLFTTVKDAVVNNLPAILGVAGVLIGIPIVVKLFKRLAK